MKKFNKLFSGIMASIMAVGASPGCKTQAGFQTKSGRLRNIVNNINNLSDDDKAFVLGTIGVFTIGAGIFWMYKKKQAEELKKRAEELKRRDDKLKGVQDGNIKFLAENLKEVIPTDKAEIFDKLVECKSENDIINWQAGLSKALGLECLQKILIQLNTYWTKVDPNNVGNHTSNVVGLCNQIKQEKESEMKQKELEMKQKEL